MRGTDSPQTHQWFGPAPTHHVFHWHYEAFDLPAGARRLASSAQCPNQAFATGPHLGLQFHVEVDAAKVEAWLDSHDPEYEQAQRGSDTVHRAGRIREDTRLHIAAQHRLADQIYLRWGMNAGLIS